VLSTTFQSLFRKETELMTVPGVRKPPALRESDETWNNNSIGLWSLYLYSTFHLWISRLLPDIISFFPGHQQRPDINTIPILLLKNQGSKAVAIFSE
jgi:hypothetical protein